jgi:hypothetical protein
MDVSADEIFVIILVLICVVSVVVLRLRSRGSSDGTTEAGVASTPPALPAREEVDRAGSGAPVKKRTG